MFRLHTAGGRCMLLCTDSSISGGQPMLASSTCLQSTRRPLRFQQSGRHTSECSRRRVCARPHSMPCAMAASAGDAGQESRQRRSRRAPMTDQQLRDWRQQHQWQQQPWWRRVLHVWRQPLLALMVAALLLGRTTQPAFASAPQRPPEAADVQPAESHQRAKRRVGKRRTGRDQEKKFKDMQEALLGALMRNGQAEDIRRIAAAEKAQDGRPVDTSQSLVVDPAKWPLEGGEDLPYSLWRPDKAKAMTYTQFWELVRERRIESAKYTHDRRSLIVKTKDNAPGGERVEKVGLPFDPDLFDHMLEHGVTIEGVNSHEGGMHMWVSLTKLTLPLVFSVGLVGLAFSIGERTEGEGVFGGARMQRVRDSSVTFKDIAGIDQIKAEVQAVVTFLQSPQRFLEVGARSPAGVLLVGAPGTGKTLLAKATAGESGVPFFNVSGTEFLEMYTGVGAARVRDMFEKARAAAPCIVFIDEFDGLGMQRSPGGGVSQSESVHTINQLLTEMDGFEDNTGVVVMAATNRPAVLDDALTRPGRFDRIIQLPVPNTAGRVEILKIHSRNKKLGKDVDLQRVARATAGMSGASLMNLMNVSAQTAVQQGRSVINSLDVFAALERIQAEDAGRGQQAAGNDDETVRPLQRRQISVYEAARALIGWMTPDFDEISKVTVCPDGEATAYTYFIPQEEHLESAVVSRGYMEARLVVSLAGRCAERMVLGDDQMSTASAVDVTAANNVAREMIYRCGFGKRIGPMALMDNAERFINMRGTRRVARIGTELAQVALTEIEELLEGAEAKAYFGLAVNYRALEAVTARLYNEGTISGVQLAETCREAGAVPFPDTFIGGFAFDRDGKVLYPAGAPLAAKGGWFHSPVKGRPYPPGSTADVLDTPTNRWSPAMPYRVRWGVPDLAGKYGRYNPHPTPSSTDPASRPDGPAHVEVV